MPSNEKQRINDPVMFIYKYSVVLETKSSRARKRIGCIKRSQLSYTMLNVNGNKCEKLCYSGQKCQSIPEALVKLYGPKVQSLDLSYNELVNLKGLEGFPHLTELVLDNNQLSDNLIFPFLPQLVTLSLNKNKIYDIESLLRKIRQNIPNLSYISLLGNKACPNELSSEDNDEEDYQRYRYYVLYHLPNLKFLDSNKVRDEERTEAKRRGKFMNIIRPKSVEDNEIIRLHAFTNNFTPLPRCIRSPEDHRESRSSNSLRSTCSRMKIRKLWKTENKWLQRNRCIWTM